MSDVGPGHEFEDELPEGEELFRAVFERAPIGLAITRRDAHGAFTIIRTNDAFTRMFGYEPHELDGKDPSAIQVSRRRSRRATDDWAYGDGSLVDSVDVRRYVRRDGTQLWAEVRATPLAVDAGGAPLLLVHALDVTEGVEAQRSRRRQSIVTECIAEVSNAALAHEDVSRVFDLIARGALTAMEADAAVILLSVPERAAKRVASTTGRLAPALSKHLEDVAARQPTTVAASEEGPRATAPSIGAVLAVPFAPDEALPPGRIVVCREPGRPPFSQPEVAELARLSSQLQVALHLAHARDDQQRLLLIEERQRIARDLHDTVIQDMIAMGMKMSAEPPNSSDPHQQTGSAELLERLDDMLVSLKRAVFQLRDTTGGRSLAREVTDAVAQASRMLPAAPMVTFAGPLDLVAPDLVDDLIAVLREALSNVARHARATSVAVSLTVTDADVLLVVDDDGVGVTGSSRSGFGVLSFTERARRHGGSVSVGPGAVVGTRVTWRCPLPP